MRIVKGQRNVTSRGKNVTGFTSVETLKMSLNYAQVQVSTCTYVGISGPDSQASMQLGGGLKFFVTGV